MPDDLDAILEKVASGELSPDAAEQLIEALDRQRRPPSPPLPSAAPSPPDPPTER